jgi:hypothetical protein
MPFLGLPAIQHNQIVKTIAFPSKVRHTAGNGYRIVIPMQAFATITSSSTIYSPDATTNL